MNRIFMAFFTVIPALLVGCGNDSPVAKIIVTDQKMPLIEWPDSSYVASLDSILALEPIKKTAETDAKINMNVFDAPLFKLPGTASAAKGSKNQKTNLAGKSAGTRQANAAKPADTSAEAFADRFSTALSKLQSDPSNASLYKTVTANEGDDLFKLLKRTYGAGVQGLPRFYVLSALQSVNAGVVLEHLNAGKPARTCPLDKDQQAVVHDWFLLTSKKVIYAANIGEEDLGKDEAELPLVKPVREIANSEGAEVLVICASAEEDISQMEPDEKALFLEDMGIGVSGLDRLVVLGYRLLGLISFLTAGPKEVRAWTIVNGTKAPQAAGKIHTDFERGFIRAEIVAYDDLIREGSMNACKEKGLVRSEGKEYVMKDGDVTLFRFNV